MRTKGETDTADTGHELDPRHWGNGFATEAMSRLVTFAFERAEMIPTGVIPDGTVWPDRYEYHLHG